MHVGLEEVDEGVHVAQVRPQRHLPEEDRIKLLLIIKTNNKNIINNNQNKNCPCCAGATASPSARGGQNKIIINIKIKLLL